MKLNFFKASSACPLFFKYKPEAFGLAPKDDTYVNELIEFSLAIFATSTGRLYSILMYSFLLGVFFLVVPIQKKQSSPTIESL